MIENDIPNNRDWRADNSRTITGTDLDGPQSQQESNSGSYIEAATKAEVKNDFNNYN